MKLADFSGLMLLTLFPELLSINKEMKSSLVYKLLKLLRLMRLEIKDLKLVLKFLESLMK